MNKRHLCFKVYYIKFEFYFSCQLNERNQEREKERLYTHLSLEIKAK
jgi:hypothetical protein